MMMIYCTLPRSNSRWVCFFVSLRGPAKPRCCARFRSETKEWVGGRNLPSSSPFFHCCQNPEWVMWWRRPGTDRMMNRSSFHLRKWDKASLMTCSVNYQPLTHLKHIHRGRLTELLTIIAVLIWELFRFYLKHLSTLVNCLWESVLLFFVIGGR